MKNLSIALLLNLIVCVSYAQKPLDTPQNTVFDQFESKDSVSGGFIRFHHDIRLEQVVENNRSVNQVTISGFRVQVFSSNEQKSAKDLAFELEAKLKQAFPDVAIYVRYTAPSWKVRMGDFLTMEAAQNFRKSLLDYFPKLKSDTYLVRDQVIPAKD